VDLMLRRLFPLLLALVVAGAPSALVVCQADCAAATHSSHAHGANGHPCHDHDPGSGARMRGVPQPCSHSDDLTATSDVTVHAPAAASACVAVTMAGSPVVSRLTQFAHWQPSDSSPHESARFRLTVSLRV